MDRKTVTTESLNYIENNIKNKITIDEIAGNAGYTKFYFSRLFKQEMKVSVMEYVRERKIDICNQRNLKWKQNSRCGN